MSNLIEKNCGACFFYPHDDNGVKPIAGKCRLLKRCKREDEGARCAHFSVWTIEKQRLTFL